MNITWTGNKKETNRNNLQRFFIILQFFSFFLRCYLTKKKFIHHIDKIVLSFFCIEEFIVSLIMEKMSMFWVHYRLFRFGVWWKAVTFTEVVCHSATLQVRCQHASGWWYGRWSPWWLLSVLQGTPTRWSRTSESTTKKHINEIGNHSFLPEKNIFFVSETEQKKHEYQ